MRNKLLRRFGRDGACVVLGAMTFFAPVIAAAAPINASWFCSAFAQSTRTEYVTGFFTADLNNPDVESAWNRYLEGQHIDAGTTGGCQRAMTLDGVKPLRDIARDSPNNIGNAKLVDVDWSFAPGQVPTSDPGKLYYYCQSGTSVAGVTYFSDVFGLAATATISSGNPAIVPFFQFVQQKYNSPPGLAVGPPSGPNNRWCEFVGNIAETERSKKAWQETLRAQGRQIVETGWKYGDAPASATSPVVLAPPVAATPPAPQQGASAARPATSQTATADPGSMYFCTSTAWPAKVAYFTRRLPLDADIRDVMGAWAKWQSLDHTPGVVETGNNATCYYGGSATEQQYRLYRQQIESNRHMDPAWRLVDVDWRFTPAQVAAQSKPGMAYGFCFVQAPGQKTLYLSAAVEMPLEYVSDSKHVVANEFAKSLMQTDLRSGTCVTRAGGTTGAEQGRQAFAADARAQGTQVVETGWTFVRTAQTPAPMPTGHP